MKLSIGLGEGDASEPMSLQIKMHHFRCFWGSVVFLQVVASVKFELCASLLLRMPGEAHGVASPSFDLFP